MFKNFSENFSLKITLTALILACLMLKASHWQWTRYLEKTKLLDTYKLSTNAIKLSDLNDTTLEENIYKKIEIEGEFDFSKQFLIANRRDASGPGFWFIAPFKPVNKVESILVSRGFIPFADRDNSSWAKYNQAVNKITGVIQKSVGQNSFVSPAQIPGQPDYIFMFPDISKICDKLASPCLSKNFYLQKINTPGEPTFPKESISIQVPPSTHFGYTFEWMLLAFLTCLIAYLLQAYPGLFSRIFMRSGTFVLIFFVFFTFNADATENSDAVTQDALIIEHLGQKLDLSSTVYTEDGEKKLSDFVGTEKPLILAPVYYECPRLCNLSQTGLYEAINALKLKLGKDYNVLSVSFNHKDTVESSKKSSAVYRSKLNKDLEPSAWKFAVTDQATIQKIMNQIGFSFKEDKGEFIHSAGLVIITPEGVISRYFYGIQFAPDQLRLALVEAANGRIGDSFDRVMMYCFRYDSTKGQYTLAVWNITRAICSIFAVALIACLVQLRRREKNLLN
jgi:protein SCO1/2